MVERVTIKRGDTSPALRVALKPETVSLVGATASFQMRYRRGAIKVDASAIIESSDPPVVRYNWSGSDTDTSGVFDAEFRVTYADGSIETFPNNGFIVVRVKEDVR